MTTNQIEAGSGGAVTLPAAGPKRGLGRGLAALIPQAAAAAGVPPGARIVAASQQEMDAPQLPAQAAVTADERLRHIPLRSITLNPHQPRKTFGREELDDLTASIREHGVLQPIVVRATDAGGKRTYELIAGERRFRAASAAGLAEIPAVVRDNVDERTSLALALIENVQREDLNVIEAAQAYDELLHTFNMTQTELAHAIGKSQPQIANALRMLHLPDPIQESLKSGVITEGHAKVILSVGDLDGMRTLWTEIVNNGLTVRQAEQRAPYLRTRKAPGGRGRAAFNERPVTGLDPQLSEISEKISLSIGTKVRLVPGRGQRGVIEISYYDNDQLDGLLSRLTGN